MTNDELKALKEGDTVTFIGGNENMYNIDNGTILTRKESWLDDDHSLAFTYDGRFGNTFHFFKAEDIKGA